MTRLETEIQLALLDDLVWVLLVVFFTANVFFTPAFPGMENQLNILYQSATLGLLVSGAGIATMVGELDLSIEAILVFVPGVTISVAQQLSLGPVVCIFMTLALGVAVGFFNGFFIAKMKTSSFLLTMSSQIVMRGLVPFLVPSSLAGFDKGCTFPGRGRIGSLQIAVPALTVIYIIFEFTFHKTVFGRRLALTGGSRRATYIPGTNADRVIIRALVLASLLSAVAGLVTAGRQNAVSNSMGEGMVMVVFADATLGSCSFNGGMRKPMGMLGGTPLLGAIDNALNLNGVDVNLASATKGGLIFLAIILDRLRFKMSADIMHKENMRELVQSNS